MPEEKKNGTYDISSDPALLNLCVEALFRLKAALVNVRLYPPSSTTAKQSIGKLYSPLVKILEKTQVLEINESSGDLLLNGKRLKTDRLEVSTKEVIKALTELFTEKHIKNITFRYGLHLEELENFILILSKKRYDSSKIEMSLNEKMAKNGIPHIKVNERIYRPVDSDDMVVAGARDHFEKNRGALDDIMRTLEEVSEIHFSDSGGTLRDEVKMQIAEKVFGLKPDLLSKFMHRGPQEKKQVEEEIYSAMNPRQLKETLSRLVSVYKSLKNSRGVPNEKIDKIKSTIKFMIDCAGDKDVGVEMSRYLLEEDLGELVSPPDSETKSPSRRAAERGRELLKKDSLALIDEDIKKELPEIFKQLEVAGEKDLIRKLTEKLSDDLQANTLSVRSSAVDLLKKIYPVFDLMSSNVAGPLFVIVRSQADSEHDGEVYKNISSILLKRSAQHIRKKEYAKVNPVVRMYTRHTEQKVEGFVKRSEYAEKFLKNLSSGDTAQILFEDLKSGDRNRQKEAYETVLEFGKHIAPALVEEIKIAEDFSLRQYMASIINEMGSDALSYLTEEIESETDTSKMVRLVQLLPALQNYELSFKYLEKCMRHPQRRVRVEAVLTLPRIEGGYNRKGRALMDCLEDKDDLVRRETIKMLGELKYEPSVKKLIDIVRSSGFASRTESDMIRQAACVALTNFEDQRVEGVLLQLVKGGRWYNFTGTPPANVKISAIRALKKSKGKKVEKALKKALRDKNEFVRSAAKSALKDNT